MSRKRKTARACLSVLGTKKGIDSTRLRSETTFCNLYPPTKHKATHVFSIIAKGRALHITSYSDEDGRWKANEIWQRRRIGQNNALKRR